MVIHHLKDSWLNGNAIVENERSYVNCHTVTHTGADGRSFDEFLSENATLDEATAIAVKRVIAWQIEQGMKAQNLNKTTMAKKMHTSRAALNRLRDENDTSLTLTTLASAAAVLGRKLKYRVVGGLKI